MSTMADKTGKIKPFKLASKGSGMALKSGKVLKAWTPSASSSEIEDMDKSGEPSKTTETASSNQSSRRRRSRWSSGDQGDDATQSRDSSRDSSKTSVSRRTSAAAVDGSLSKPSKTSSSNIPPANTTVGGYSSEMASSSKTSNTPLSTPSAAYEVTSLLRAHAQLMTAFACCGSPMVTVAVGPNDHSSGFAVAPPSAGSRFSFAWPHADPPVAGLIHLAISFQKSEMHWFGWFYGNGL